MVTVTIDGKKYSGKEVIVNEWSGHAHDDFVHYFTDEYDGADKLKKKK
jgi:hypothetical protein